MNPKLFTTVFILFGLIWFSQADTYNDGDPIVDGDIITIKGTGYTKCIPQGESYVINFKIGNDIDLHFNVRTYNGQLYESSYINGGWPHSGSGAISSYGILTGLNDPIELAFKFTATGYEISSFGTYIPSLDYTHKIDPPIIDSIETVCISNAEITIDSGSTTTTQAPRDCSVLAIDEFLLQCSVEFPSAQQQVTDLDSKLTTLETNLQTQVDQNTADIAQLQTDLTNGQTGSTTQIQQLQTDLLDVNARIDLFAAQSPGNFNIDGENLVNNNGVSLTDVIIICALMVNFMVMVYIYCWKQNGSNKQHVYVVPQDVESDAEQVHLK